jgi:hypothetical protein
MLRARTHIVLALLCAAPAAARAEDTTPAPTVSSVRPHGFSMARAMGMAGAHLAIASGTDAIYLNPAGMVVGQKYVMEGFYQFDRGKGADVFGGCIVDSRSGWPLAMGISYSYFNVANVRAGSLVDMAFAVPVLPPLGFGVTIKYVDVGPEQADKPRTFTGDVGLLFTPFPWLAIGAAGYNLIRVGAPNEPQSVAAGASVGDDSTFHLAFDWRMDFVDATPLGPRPEHRFAAGAEALLLGAVPVRAGWAWEPQSDGSYRNYLALGTGLVVQGFGFDASARIRPDGGEWIWAFSVKVYP